MIEVDVHCGKHKVLEWTVNKENETTHLDWMCKHVKWEHELKKAVCKEIKRLYFPGEVDAPGFADYVFTKKCVRKEGKMVNMNAGQKDPNQDIVLRKVMWHECMIIKFCRGDMADPTNWTQVFNYAKKHSYHKFNLETDINDNAIRLTDLKCQCNEIPQAPLENVYGGRKHYPPRPTHTRLPTSNFNHPYDTMPQTGGYNADKYYAEKYLKYKDKYLSLRGGF